MLDAHVTTPLDCGRLQFHRGLHLALALRTPGAKGGDLLGRTMARDASRREARGRSLWSRRHISGHFLLARQRLQLHRRCAVPLKLVTNRSKSTPPSPSLPTIQTVSDSLALMGRGLLFGALCGASLTSRDLETLGAALINLHGRLSPARKKEERP